MDVISVLVDSKPASFLKWILSFQPSPIYLLYADSRGYVCAGMFDVSNELTKGMVWSS